jgi:hypothetical protein
MVGRHAIRDLWPESIVALGALRHGWAIRLCERIEACLLTAITGDRIAKDAEPPPITAPGG